MSVRLRLIAFYVLTIGSVGALHPFLGLALERAGAPDAFKAALMALFPVGFLVAGPLWTWIADRSGRPSVVMRVAAWLTAFAAVAFAATGVWQWMVPSILVLAICRAPLVSLADATTVRALGDDSDAYGQVRLWGSVSFVVGVVVVGRLLPWSWRAPMIAAAVLLTGSALVAPLLPRLDGDVDLRADPRVLARTPGLAGMWPLAVAHGVAISSYDFFFSIHVERLGLSEQVTAAGVGLGVVAEIALMAFSPAVLRRVGAQRLMWLGLASSVPRFLVTAMVPIPAVQIGAQALHGLGFGAWWMGGVALLAERAPPNLRNSAQGLFVAAGFGVGPLICMVLAGTLLPRFGTNGLFLLSAAIATAASLAGRWLLRPLPRT